uniref:Craniofacial development protein 1 n=2 Tax=Solanum tuberosum TaxID=4113 RepID=M1D1I2_SOLTU
MAKLTAEAQLVQNNLENVDGFQTMPKQESACLPNMQMQPEEIERKARVDAVWEQMNKGVSTRTLYSIINKPTSASNKTSSKSSSKSSSSSWMTVLGLSQKKASEPGRSTPEKRLRTTQNDTSEESKKLAAAALSAVKEAATAAASAGRGKVITEVRDFAGEDVEIKKYVDANSAEASDKGKGPAPPASAVDIILEQIKKKQKLSVLDKTKKDWEGFKGENRGMEEELDAYKKSSNQYLDRVGFLERADYREFERERDARLAMHAKRKPESMREDY